jgi:hypothetical protein
MVNVAVDAELRIFSGKKYDCTKIRVGIWSAGAYRCFNRRNQLVR